VWCRNALNRQPSLGHDEGHRHFGKTDASPSATYTVVVTSAHQAAELISDHLGLRQPWERIDVKVIESERVEGPARVLQPGAEGSA